MDGSPPQNVSGGIRPDEADYLVGFGVSGLLGGQTKGKSEMSENDVLSVPGHADFLSVFFEIRSLKVKRSLKVPHGDSVWLHQSLAFDPRVLGLAPE